jgi:type IV pilus assembly protein PilE
MTRRSPQGGLTVIEALTVAVALVVVVAVVVPLWRSHDLRARRADAMEALEALQKAQDRFFGSNARYADAALMQSAPPAGLGLRPRSRQGFFNIDLQRSADALAYVATARWIPRPDVAVDSRCVEFRVDQAGRRTSLDETGADTSADCWNEL